MTSRRRALRAALAAPLLALAACSAPPADLTELRPEETEVLMALLADAAGPGPYVRQLVMPAATVPLSKAASGDLNIEQTKWALPDVSDTAWRDFERVGMTPVPLRLPLERLAPQWRQNPYRIAAPKEIEAAFQNRGMSGWKDFYQAFPSAAGILRLSRVGLDTWRGQAIAYTEFSCGGLCANGEMHLLRKREGTWRTEDTKMIWIS